jgi:CO/xanthine dehydrogenase Mo-binding subunit
VALVAAVSAEIAQQALDLVEVDYEARWSAAVSAVKKIPPWTFAP